MTASQTKIELTVHRIPLASIPYFRLWRRIAQIFCFLSPMSPSDKLRLYPCFASQGWSLFWRPSLKPKESLPLRSGGAQGGQLIASRDPLVKDGL